ncbi:MAG TPA: methyltransferase domain-containing protein [Candidatus Binatia bacterium]
MKRSAEAEMMDLPDQPRELLIDDLRNLRLINRYLGCHRNALRGLARAMGGRSARRFALLDVGTGSADIPAVIAQWARRRKIAAHISALEREGVTLELAAARTRDFSEISIIRGDALAPPFRAKSFDFVLASQLLHHFPDEQIVALLRTWAGLARRAVIVSDLVRHPLAYHGIRLLTKTFTRNVMTLTDAPLSVKRALTVEEWRALFRRADVGNVFVEGALPFRVLGLIWPQG